MPNQEILRTIANNPELLQAVKDVFLKQFSIDGIDLLRKVDVSDELLGQALRARSVGIKGVEDACREIESYKTLPLSPEKGNPAY